MDLLPYPPAPELGWYQDDVAVSDKEAAPATQIASDAAVMTAQPSTNIADREDDVDDWDGTVLSTKFSTKAPTKTYLLHNDLTGQEVVVDRGTLLGRKPSGTVPQGARAVRLEDPTRTISRNHAAISIDEDGALWVEDYGSLNGTYVIRDGQETQVVQGTPVRVDVPATLRIGDQFFGFDERV